MIISPLKSAIQKISSTGVYGIVNSHRYEDYGPKEYGNDRIRFPYSYWTGNAEKFANSFYAYQFAKDFSNDFSIKDKS